MNEDGEQVHEGGESPVGGHYQESPGASPGRADGRMGGGGMQHFGRKFITNGLRDISIEEDMGGDMGGVSPGVRIDGGMAVGDAQQQQMQ